MMAKAADHATTGLAGEYYVLAQLAHRGFVGTMTLGHTKGVDILVSNPALSSLFKVEVKTTQKTPAHERLFGKGQFLRWVMSAKHEMISDPKLYYCFVFLRGPADRPRFFVVPSKYVAQYVHHEHRQWLASRKQTESPTPMRTFRIPSDDPDGFEDNWDVFKGKAGQQGVRTGEAKRTTVSQLNSGVRRSMRNQYPD
jgi:hypothetical protein